ncbi:MAG: 1-(5-phosphoribosyl)-5-[(5-phosphoribosylamino)methylideneamino]imidazole-4-carboxamide isomerase [Gammaproteobacteria bacterium]|nr:1-(5-phosphoribosyl)-5-[(5-phosphoribosylamino)methylideneamino]imidazole-4-carboxamide isomerase [Gammaproteobacteria bacterium]
MQIIPAIDLREGRVVNLKQGRAEEETTYSHDPLGIAERWIREGAERLHIVDLDGAFSGAPVNKSVVKEIKKRYPDIAIQLGGGIRSRENIISYLDAGVDLVILGTIGVTDPEFLKTVCSEFVGRIVLGLDALGGKVAVNGWKEVTDLDAVRLALEAVSAGVSSIIFTDIGRDGMMDGVNVEATSELAKKISVPVIASGGVKGIEDIEALLEANHNLDGSIEGVILGRSIYEKTLSVSTAIERTQASQEI